MHNSKVPKVALHGGQMQLAVGMQANGAGLQRHIERVVAAFPAHGNVRPLPIGAGEAAIKPYLQLARIGTHGRTNLPCIT